MRSLRSLILLALLAAGLGFIAGFWVRDRSQDSLERRTRAAVERVRKAFQTLTP